jgi:cytochrome c biogenesis protein CcmG, thiol:disulfide interchange protein DsbE
MRKGPAIVVLVLAAALVGLLSYGVAQRGEDTTIQAALARGERVSTPDYTAPLGLLGAPATQRSLADYKGKVVVLNFWASWCDPCVEELPLLERTQRRIAPRNASVVGINGRDVTGDALGFVRRFDLTFPSLRDPDAELNRKFGLTGLPETFVIDRKGRIAAKRVGPVDQAWLDATLPRLLAEPT